MNFRRVGDGCLGSALGAMCGAAIAVVLMVLHPAQSFEGTDGMAWLVVFPIVAAKIGACLAVVGFAVGLYFGSKRR